MTNNKLIEGGITCLRNLRELFNSSSCYLFIAATKKIRIAMMIALINGRWIAKFRNEVCTRRRFFNTLGEINTVKSHNTCNNYDLLYLGTDEGLYIH